MAQMIVSGIALGAIYGLVALGIVLVDDETIHRMNREYLAHDEPTDIITFALDDEGFITGPGGMPRELGEMYISYERAAAQSADWASDPEREIRFLVVHGVAGVKTACGMVQPIPPAAPGLT